MNGNGKESPSCKPPEENAFWRGYDKVAKVIRAPSFLYWCAGLYLLGTILGLIAPYFK